MTFICATSDKYIHLVEGFAKRFNEVIGKYPVNVVGYSYKPGMLSSWPDNFRFTSLGKQPGNRVWTDGMISYLNTVTDKRVALFLEDYWLKRFDADLYAKALAYMGEIGAKKLDLTMDRNQFGHTQTKWLFIEANQTAQYRMSLQAAIWDTQYLLECMVPGETIWEFEVQGSKRRLNDGAIILGTTKGILEYDNKMKMGEPQ